MTKNATSKQLMTNWRWWMCVLLFVATTVNYMDRQVLSLTWRDERPPRQYLDPHHFPPPGRCGAVGLQYTRCLDASPPLPSEYDRPADEDRTGELSVVRSIP